MILEIVQYGHPALRAKGARIEKIDDALVELIQDMLDTMYDADGVGLAAQQIGRPLQLCVIDVDGVTDRPSALRIGGKTADIAEHMPMILINPEVELLGKEKTGPEGCLSFPGIRADITRPYSVRVKATQLDGSELIFEADGLLARAVQHEYDHLQGILFIDRMDPAERKKMAEEIESLRIS